MKHIPVTNLVFRLLSLSRSRTLVPLSTFCKHKNMRFMHSQKLPYLSRSSLFIYSNVMQNTHFKNTVSLFCACNFVAKVANHYDVLEISPKAGQSQVKAAYYRLSKKYHPDINKDHDAKVKFGQIAEAYEILGNKRLRGQYDRTIGMGSSRVHSKQVYDSDYQHIIKNRGEFKRRTSSHPMGKSDIYDFDEFYKQHYGTYVKMSKEKMQSEEAFVKELNRNKRQVRRQSIIYGSVLVAAMIASFIYGIKSKN